MQEWKFMHTSAVSASVYICTIIQQCHITYSFAVVVVVSFLFITFQVDALFLPMSVIIRWSTISLSLPKKNGEKDIKITAPYQFLIIETENLQNVYQ